MQRLEYFDMLPAWMFDDFKGIHENGPAAYGLSQGEWRQFIYDRYEHMVEGFKLNYMGVERRRRLQDAVRKTVSSCADLESANAILDTYGPLCGPTCYCRTEGEDVRSYVMRRELWLDYSSEWNGAHHGWLDAFRAHQKRKALQWSSREM